MAWLWTILKKVGPHTEDCINRAIRDRAEVYGLGGSSWTARGRASTEVYDEVKRLYREGGVEAVRQEFRCIPREHLISEWDDDQ